MRNLHHLPLLDTQKADDELVKSASVSWAVAMSVTVFKSFKPTEKTAVRNGLNPIKCFLDQKGLPIDELPEPLRTKFRNGLRFKA